MRVPMFCAALLSALAGCDTTSPPGSFPPASTCLTIDDVINIPPGDATGTKDWGTYRTVTNFRESCTQCDQNTDPGATCTTDTIDPNARAVYRQEGGVLVTQGSDGNTAQGGINADGTFTLGVASTAGTIDGEPAGQGLALLEGRFVGDRIVITMTFRMTVNSPDGVVDLQAVHAVTQERVE